MEHDTKFYLSKSAQSDIISCLYEAIDAYYTKWADKPSLLLLNRKAFGAFKVFTQSYNPYAIQSQTYSYSGIRVMCNPNQPEFVLALGEADHAFAMEGF